MSKQQQIKYLIECYTIPFETAYEKLSVKVWNMMMEAEEIRD
ncbi:hypothetical protein [Yersinia similis]|uniref:Uncharacterized protein n=1 Tax=Yersinia similis TaxID=367190 RepID=A0A0T9R872_9GAMM|nr:hypothetical protein [Yersinia similis]CFQ49873.1 Uncharacterised protein [Yersinia similis]CNC22718.1 Uncharacterised protein [Yersinia similis]CNI49786.1 Uncharacterised protein [Yersinia similis]